MGLIVANNITQVNIEETSYDAILVTPADGTDLPSGVCVGLFIGGNTGNVAVNLVDDATGSFTGTAVLTSLAAGQIIRCGISRVKATSTTATVIYALYRPGVH